MTTRGSTTPPASDHAAATTIELDPWVVAPPSWTPLAGDSVARAKWPPLTRKPFLWEHVVTPEDRALLAGLARQVLDAEPGIGFAFHVRFLERIRARGAAATSDAERERLRGLEQLVSDRLPDLPDLYARLQVLRGERAGA